MTLEWVASNMNLWGGLLLGPLGALWCWWTAVSRPFSFLDMSSSAAKPAAKKRPANGAPTSSKPPAKRSEFAKMAAIASDPHALLRNAREKRGAEMAAMLLVEGEDDSSSSENAGALCWC